MARKLSKRTARAMARARTTHGGPPVIRMRCGECGQALTMTEWRVHPPLCPKRPEPEVAQ